MAILPQVINDAHARAVLLESYSRALLAFAVLAWHSLVATGGLTRRLRLPAVLIFLLGWGCLQLWHVHVDELQVQWEFCGKYCRACARSAAVILLTHSSSCLCCACVVLSRRDWRTNARRRRLPAVLSLRQRRVWLWLRWCVWHALILLSGCK